MDVSIIIVNYNTAELVENCLQSIYNKTAHLNFEIIVVDNNSPERIIQNTVLKYPKIIFIQNSTNSGFGSANNVGAKNAKGKYLFFLNSDTILINNAIHILKTFMDSSSTIAVSGCNLYTKGLQPTYSFSHIMPGVVSEIDNALFNSYSKLLFKKSIFFNFTNKPIKIKGNCSGAALMIRNKIFKSHNNFDEDFFMYYEEVYLLHCLRKKGYDIYNCPAGQIIHLENGMNVSDNSKINTIISKAIYFRKVHNKTYYYICSMINLFSLTSRFIYCTMANDKNKRNNFKNDIFNFFKYGKY